MATAPIASLAPSSPAAIQAVSPEARRALVGSAVGYAMDGFDLLILGFMLRAISAELGLTPPQAASLVTATLIGAVCGGVLFGMLADRLGRVRVLAWTILLFAVFTGLCALAQGYWDLLAYRTVAGLGLGGEFGIGMALVGEAWPAAKRARASAYVGLGWQFGVLAAALVTPLLLPLIGWRGMFAVGLFPAVAAFFIRRNLQEPDAVPGEGGAGEGTAAVAETAGRRCANHTHQSRHDHPLRRAELRLLRRDDMAAELPFDAVRIQPDAILHMDRRHCPGHGHRHLCVRPDRGSGQPPPRVPQLHAGGRDHGGGLFPDDRRDGAADRRRGDGILRQRDAGWIRRADERAVSDDRRVPRRRTCCSISAAASAGSVRWRSAPLRYVSALTRPSRCLRCCT